MPAWVVYNIADGQERWRQQDQNPDAARQQVLPEGMALLECSPEVLSTIPINLDLLKAELRHKIDKATEEQRKKIITSEPSKIAAYFYKETQARAWIDGVSNPVDFPWLALEAAAVDMSITDLAALIISNANANGLAGAQVEATCMGAKKALADATNLTEVAAALNITWPE